MTAMLRVRSSSLVLGEDGKLRYRDAPFSGLAYGVEDDVLVSISVVEAGTVTGISNDWIALPPGGARVDWSCLDELEDYGPLTFRDALFTGVAYRFARTGTCSAEVEYVGGYATGKSEREWYPTGAPRMVIGGGEYSSWFEDGRWMRRATNGEVVYNLIARDDGRLAGIVLRDPNLFDLAGISRMALADDFMLLGSAIDTKRLRILRDNSKLDTVRVLRLLKTSIDPGGVDILLSLHGLAELTLEGNAALRVEEARRIKAERPTWRVEFENEVLANHA